MRKSQRQTVAYLLLTSALFNLQLPWFIFKAERQKKEILKEQHYINLEHKHSMNNIKAWKSTSAETKNKHVAVCPELASAHSANKRSVPN